MKREDILYLLSGSFITLFGMCLKTLLELHVSRLKLCWGAFSLSRNASRNPSPNVSEEELNNSAERASPI